MKRCILPAVGVVAAVASPAWATGRVWILPIDERRGDGWTEVATGGYPGTHDGAYWYGKVQNFGTCGEGGVRQVYWKFDTGGFAPADPEIGNTTEAPNPEPRLYLVELWRAPDHNNAYNTIEVDPNGRNNGDPGDLYYRNPYIPWNGAFGQNHQWLKTNTESSTINDWLMSGPGPQAPLALPETDPANPAFGYALAACASGPSGQMMWFRKGSDLYINYNQGHYGNQCNLEIAVSAVRVTELNALPFPPCGEATYGGPVDLRCIGNADPLQGTGKSPWWDSAESEPFVHGAEGRLIAPNDHTLAADGYVLPCATTLRQPQDPWPVPTPLTPGLPPDGNYTAQTENGPVSFKLLYGGPAAIQWDAGQNNPMSPFFNARVFTLNEQPQQEFLAGSYSAVHLLSVKSGGNNGELIVKLIYDDATIEQHSFSLYDWFGTDGDATSRAVGVGGVLRSAGGTGFRRLRDHAPEFRSNVNEDWNGYPSDGGDANGAFLFVHSAPVNQARTLSQIQLQVAPDGRGFGGRVNIIAVTLSPPSCATPVFDVTGGGPDGTEPDGVVDLLDFGVFQRCYTGDDDSQFNPADCLCFDRVEPFGRIDSLDLAAFSNCFGRSAVPAPPGCDE